MDEKLFGKKRISDFGGENDQFVKKCKKNSEENLVLGGENGQKVVKEWKAGRALKKREKWLEVVEIVKSNKLPIKSFAMEAIENGELDIFHRSVKRRNTGKVRFNNKDYENQEALVAEYKAKPDCNYLGAKDHVEVCRKMIKEYTEKKICREVTENWELEKVTINPINVMETKKDKFSLICHTLCNAEYSKPRVELLDITDRGQVIKDMSEFRTEDLKSAYRESQLIIL